MISISVITDQQTEVSALLKEFQLEKDISLIDQKRLLGLADDNPFDDKEIERSQKVFLLGNEISLRPDWSVKLPPILFPFPVPFTKYNLLSILFLLLGDEQQALQYAGESSELKEVILAYSALKHNLPIAADFQENTKVFQFHNAALLAHYGLLQGKTDFLEIDSYYKKAIEHSTNPQRGTFTKYHYSLFLLDTGFTEEAILLLEKVLEKQHLESRISLLINYQYADALLINASKEQLPKIKQLLKALIKMSTNLNDPYREAMVMQLASEVAEMEDNYMEALGCLQKALSYFNEHKLEMLAANAHYRKGDLLLAWAHKGNLTMFSKAAESFREALQVFTKETMPETFAGIHHKLGMIYAEMPFQAEKRAMIAALSVTSFNEALAYFTKETSPYEYASIQQDMGNAYLKYPESLLNDNYRKAIQYYQEALTIRTTESYPLERSLTLLNYLEALWLVPQEDQLSESLMEEMESMAKEVKAIGADKALVDEAQRHLNELAQLKITMKDA